MSSPLFGIGAALSWGAGDFAGGIAAKRWPVLRVVLVSQALGLASILGIALLMGERVPSVSVLGVAALAGLAGAVGVAALYRGLAIGRMGVVAPVTAVLSAGVPVVFAAFAVGLPSPWQGLGFALAVAGIFLVSKPERGAVREKGLGHALVAGLGFGALLLLLGLAGESGSVWWLLVAARVASVLVVGILVLAARHEAPTEPGSAWGLALAAGALDVAGNAFYVFATQAGRLDVAAVLASLYPVATVVLARILLKERLARVQDVGLVLAFVAIPFIAL